MTDVRVGVMPLGLVDGPAAARRDGLRRIADAGLDHVGTGDHVSFFVGWGDDALIRSAQLLSLHDTLPVYVGVYLLPLRHPVTVARQLATIAEFAPGRLTLGVGVGGEDRHEIEICGVDPASRGRRTDESMRVLRSLLTGDGVTFDGEFFSITDARILPAPSEPIPLVVGGRSEAAVRRAGRFGDGWLGIWVSPRRFADAVERAASYAEEAGRRGVGWQHAMQVWCGLARSHEEARSALASGMEAVYQTPFDRFERYCPCGTGEQVAEFLAPYVDAGCTTFNLIPRGPDADVVLEQAAEVKRHLVRSVPV